MVSVVVPFRAGGKTRLPGVVRAEVALAMLGDVLEAARAVGAVVLVTDDPRATALADGCGAASVVDPGRGQGAAVLAGLSGRTGPCLVVNADCPCVGVPELQQLAAVAQAGRFALVAAEDGTTNALALPSPAAFAPLYGEGSAAALAAHAVSLGLTAELLRLGGLEQDVDTMADLERVLAIAGPRTRSVAEGILA